MTKKHGVGSNKASDYHTQRNNEISPHTTCNATAYVMASKRAGIPMPHGKEHKQPEDYFVNFLRSRRARRYMAHTFSWAKNIDPNEVHGMLMWGYEQLCGASGRSMFATNWTLTDLVWYVSQGAGVVLIGDFPHYRYGKIGHLVSLATYDYEGVTVEDDPDAVKLDKLKSITIDDPYGNYKCGYNPAVRGFDKGNDVVMNKEDVLSILRHAGGNEGYWAHVIAKLEHFL